MNSCAGFWLEIQDNLLTNKVRCARHIGTILTVPVATKRLNPSCILSGISVARQTWSSLADSYGSAAFFTLPLDYGKPGITRFSKEPRAVNVNLVPLSMMWSSRMRQASASIQMAFSRLTNTRSPGDLLRNSTVDCLVAVCKYIGAHGLLSPPSIDSPYALVRSIAALYMTLETQLVGFDSQEDSFMTSAHIVQSGSSSKAPNHGFHDRTSGRSGSVSRGRMRGRGRRNNGYLVVDCRYRIDQTFTGRTTECVTPRGDSGSVSYSSLEPATISVEDCSCCTKARAKAQVCYSSQPQSHVTTSIMDHWVVYSGATHHVTPDSANVIN
ncbi:hypothetical protein F3Y22_tig00110656pilonHSYRG00136 [Hibiscus syriacus]|uniref:Uncharacterized protein n=1 Tax=Hibiscus syriacus TaxID=106335 RepID=A0A6A2ZX24_HIBSY|nr:hypothetical protein F3Y22_tig00110656pilonHSYRG00136 [Hibiscus syriacus]